MQYIPKNLYKFIIKLWLAVDVETKDILYIIPYSGKDETRASSSVFQLGCHLSSGILLWKGKKCYNFFTPYCLAKLLRQKKTSIVGMFDKVRKELPPSAKATQATR